MTVVRPSAVKTNLAACSARFDASTPVEDDSESNEVQNEVGEESGKTFNFGLLIFFLHTRDLGRLMLATSHGFLMQRKLARL